MLQTRGIPKDLIKIGILSRMRAFGLSVDADVGFPELPQHLQFGPELGHLCYGDDKEVFPCGVPVMSTITVIQEGGPPWRASLPQGTSPYWTGEIWLTHQWNVPPMRGRRLLHFLEAASLLTLYPRLGAVRYFSQNGTDGSAELFVNREGKIKVWCGTGKSTSHHMATVEGPSMYRILEEKIGW